MSPRSRGEDGWDGSPAPGAEVEHMHAHLAGKFREGQGHYHGEVERLEKPDPEPEFHAGDQVEFLSSGLRGSGWYPAEFVSYVGREKVRILPPDSDWITVPVGAVRKQRTGLHRHGNYDPHSHEVRPDHKGVPQRPMKVHGPLDTPAMQHNQQAEQLAVRVLQARTTGPSARYDAEQLLVSLGWPALAIRLAKQEKI